MTDKTDPAAVLAVMKGILAELNDAKKFDDNAPYPAKCEVIGYREALVDVAMKLDTIPCAPLTDPAVAVLRAADNYVKAERNEPGWQVNFLGMLLDAVDAWRAAGGREKLDAPAPPAEMGLDIEGAIRDAMYDELQRGDRKPPTPPAVLAAVRETVDAWYYLPELATCCRHVLKKVKEKLDTFIPRVRVVEGEIRQDSDRTLTIILDDPMDVEYEPGQYVKVLIEE